MHAFIRFAAIGAILVVSSLQAPTASADVIYVSKAGADGPGCGAFTAPCGSFQGGIDAATSGDTVHLLGPAVFIQGYITKSLTVRGNVIIQPEASYPCVNINAGPADYVAIFELTCQQTDVSADGILYLTGSQLLVFDVRIGGAGGACGIRVWHDGLRASLHGSNLVIANFEKGVCITPEGSARVYGELREVRLQDNAYGLYSIPGAAAEVNVIFTSGSIRGGLTGIYSSGHSLIRVRGSGITNNTLGLDHIGDAEIASLGGNTLAANTTNGTFTLVFVPQ